MDNEHTIDFKPGIEKVVREVIRPLEEKVKQLEATVQQQRQQIDKINEQMAGRTGV